MCTCLCPEDLQQSSEQSPEFPDSVNTSNAVALKKEEMLVALTYILGWLLVGDY